MSCDWYDKQGKPITIEEADPLLRDKDYKMIARTLAGDGEVSTVWLGLDHSLMDGPPQIFETLIFGGSSDGDMWRYSTEAEAKAGHKKVVSMLKAKAAFKLGGE